jgi:hypothetical protein
MMALVHILIIMKLCTVCVCNVDFEDSYSANYPNSRRNSETNQGPVGKAGKDCLHCSTFSMLIALSTFQL